ncbi:hypothetical protein Tco_0716921 [Tanacetum coccineum]
MASMKYCDKHNQVGFLKKPEESTGFAEIVDFLKGSHIRYALTHNLTIHDSLVKQFWQTATASTLADGTLELRATIDTLEYTITEASVRNQAVDQPSPSEPLPSSFHPPVISATTESEPTPVAETTPHPKSPSPEPDSEPFEHTFEQPSPEHQPLSHRQDTEVPQTQDPTHPNVAEARTMTVDDLLHLVPKLITKVDSLETGLKQTKLTMGKALVKLVKKVKKMKVVLKRRHVVLLDSEDEDAEISSKQRRNLQDEGLDEMVRNMMKDKSEVFKTPTQSKTSGEEDISPTTLEAAKTLSNVASQRTKSVDNGKRYKRRKESNGKDISTGFEDISTGFEEVNTGGLGVNTGSGPVSSGRGQRERKAPIIVEETRAPKRTKEQIQQEEASLAEAIRLQTLEEEETAKQVHLDALLAKRMEEEELTEQQKQRKAQVQFEAQQYTKEYWDAIRAKLEANAELTKNVIGKELPKEDFAKKMVELVNQIKKFFAEERAKAKRSKPVTQSQLRNYMMNYLKNQGTWKLTQLKKLSFEEVKEEFDKLVKQVESFVPLNIKATKAQLKRYREELQTEISKKQRIGDKNISVKKEEPVKRVGKRKKQKARKGISIDKSPQGDSETNKEESVEAMNPTPLDTKSNIMVNWKIFQQGERSIYQIIRANGPDTVYMSFGAMLKDFTIEDLIKLYRLVIQKYGTNRPEDAYDREAHNEDIQRNLKFTSEDQVRGGLLGIIVNRLKSGSYRVKSGRHIDLDLFKLAIVLQKAKQIQDFGPTDNNLDLGFLKKMHYGLTLKQVMARNCKKIQKVYEFKRFLNRLNDDDVIVVPHEDAQATLGDTNDPFTSILKSKDFADKDISANDAY